MAPGTNIKVSRMKKKQFRSSHPRTVNSVDGDTIDYCGIRCCLEVLGGKWKMLIIAELLKGRRRYSDLKRSIPEVSHKMLTDSLRELEYHHIVERTMLNIKGVQVEYSLSPYGKTVRPVLQVLYNWGDNHIKTHVDKVFQ